MFEKLTSETTALPSLNALRAFEVMARTGSATRAAEELNVTHSAVSRQVKALEAQLGQRLFEGPKHALILTSAGRDLSQVLTLAFDDIAAAVAKTRGKGDDLHVAVNASLAVKWLIPRLSGLQREHPRLRVHLADLAAHATSHRGADIIVRLLSADQLAELPAYPIIPNAIGPVIAPQLAGDDAMAAIDAHPRLISRTHVSAWQDWSQLSGRPLAFNGTWARPLAHLHFVFDAAVSGLGSAVLPWAIVSDAVQSGQLLAPYGFCRDGGAVAALAGAGDMVQSRRQFLRWIQAQGEQMLPPPPPVSANL